MNFETMTIGPSKPYPGNEIPVRLYRGALSGDTSQLTAGFRKRFTENGWSDPWIAGVYDFHHFHAEAHEALGCAAGWVLVQLGGPDGEEVRLEAGDAVLLPAGVSHKNIDSSPDYRIMGAYPHNQEPDLRRGDPDEWDEVLEKIAQVKRWDKDPVTGETE